MRRILLLYLLQLQAACECVPWVFVLFVVSDLVVLIWLWGCSLMLVLGVCWFGGWCFVVG